MLYSKCKAVKTQEKGNTTMKVRVEVDSDLQEEWGCEKMRNHFFTPLPFT